MKPSAIPPAIVGGSVQIAGNNLFSLVPGHERGVPLTIIAPGAVFDKTDENGYVGLVVKKSSTLKTGEDFTGKTVGVNDLKGFDAMAVMSWIDKTGGDSSKVNFVEMPAPSAGPAVAAGRIDATILTIPYLSEMLKTGEVKVLTDAYSAIAPSYLGLAWVTTTAFADAHPDLIARFGRVIHDANLYVNGHHEATVQMMADLAKVDPSRVRGVTRVSFAPYVTPELVQPVIDLLAKYKVISKPFPASEMISPYALKPGEK
jgi:NitT/TauT family transport system substrate-binding protein